MYELVASIQNGNTTQSEIRLGNSELLVAHIDAHRTKLCRFDLRKFESSRSDLVQRVLHEDRGRR